MAGALKSLKMSSLGVPVSAATFMRDRFAVADGDGRLHVTAPDGSVMSYQAHDGAVLGLAADDKSQAIFTAGDDGKVLRFTLGDEQVSVLHDGRKWVDTLAAGGRGAVAWSAGKQVHLLARSDSDAVTVDLPSTASGLAFSEDGKWLGAAVYGGALLIAVADPSQVKMLEWKGSHLSVGFSRDGRFCVTAMLENALHVWRLDKPAEKHGRMGGYPAKPLSFAFSADARVMATAGADRLVLWPFQGPDGPVGQGAQVYETGGVLLRTVASRPQSRQFALGDVGGAVSLFDRKDNSLHAVVAAGDSPSPVIALDFSADGKWLGFAREDGTIGLAEPA